MKDVKAKKKDHDTVMPLDSLIPANPNVGNKRAKVTRQKKPKTKDTKNSPETVVEKFTGKSNPFKNSKELCNHYRASLTLKFGSDIVFESFAQETHWAGEVLDVLIENEREDVKFLNSWIDYFSRTRLRGKKKENASNTSLKAFKGTFDEFARRSK